MRDQAVAGIFDQVQHMRESGIAAVVRVGHDGVLMKAAEFCQPPQLASVRGWAALLGQCEIIPIHSKQKIMLLEILIAQLPGAQVGEVITALASSMLTAPVRRLPWVIVVRAGRSNKDLVC